MIDTLPMWFWIPAGIILWTALVCLYIADRRRRVEASPLQQAHLGYVSPPTRTRSAAAVALHRVRSTSREGAEVARRAPHPSIEGRTHHTTEHRGCARTLQPQGRREARSQDHELAKTFERSGTRGDQTVVTVQIIGGD